MSIVSLAIGVVLSIYYNSLFLFIFLPFGFGWGFSNKSEHDKREKDNRGEIRERD
ncbi:MAG: hypothetical protein PXY39_01110 [archaeon]|nr:hypothetical protein [archaeon]